MGFLIALIISPSPLLPFSLLLFIVRRGTVFVRFCFVVPPSCAFKQTRPPLFPLFGVSSSGKRVEGRPQAHQEIGNRRRMAEEYDHTAQLPKTEEQPQQHQPAHDEYTYDVKDQQQHHQHAQEEHQPHQYKTLPSEDTRGRYSSVQRRSGSGGFCQSSIPTGNGRTQKTIHRNPIGIRNLNCTVGVYFFCDCALVRAARLALCPVPFIQSQELHFRQRKKLPISIST